MIMGLALFSGIAWTVVYVEAIRLGLRDQTYAMPVAALGLNLAWERIYAVQGVSGETAHVQSVVNGVWACADIGILYTYFRFARREVKRGRWQWPSGWAPWRRRFRSAFWEPRSMCSSWGSACCARCWT